MKTIVTVLSIFAATCAWLKAAPKFEEIEEVKIEYGKWTAKSEVSYWDIVFSADEIKPLRDFLKRAKLAETRDGVLFTTALRGTLVTANGNFELAMGDEKTAPQAYGISVSPIPKGGRSKTDHFRLSESDGKEFREIVDRLIAPKITRNPDRIVKHQ